MIGPKRALKRWLAVSVMMTLCASAQAELLSVNVNEDNVASLVLVYQGQVINGYQTVDQGLTKIALSAVAETRVAGTGTGGPDSIFDGSHAVEVLQTPWGSTEIIFGCFTADVVLYQNDKNNEPSFLAAGSVVTDYCPSQSGSWSR